MLNPLNRFRQLHKSPDFAALVSDHAPVRPFKAGRTGGVARVAPAAASVSLSHPAFGPNPHHPIDPENALARRAAGPRRRAAGDGQSARVSAAGPPSRTRQAPHQETGDDS
ncbi:hypothetical protein BVI2075_40064 [Burkholderia vietnamiensis]|nr:hypothetical protein BVI2075_40064 [Burkholderia vietnamiensis]CAG9231948.1 hypothetical protein BVI1335_810011 [Burkholderia vietnamiensis]